MSNSGTCTSCFADFISLPMPALRAIKSPSLSVIASCCNVAPFVGGRVGDAERVGGSVGISMSIMMVDCRRIAGSSANRVAIGLGGLRDVGESRTAVDGRSKDHERTRSKASAWQPNGQIGSVCYIKAKKNTHPFDGIHGLFEGQI